MSQPSASSDLQAVMEGMLEELAIAFAAHNGRSEPSDEDRHLAVIAAHTLGEWAIRPGNPAVAIARAATGHGRAIIERVVAALRHAGGRDGAHGSKPALHAAADWLEHELRTPGAFLHAAGDADGHA